MPTPILLSELPCGQSAVITAIYAQGPMLQRLFDVGLTENARIQAMGKSPFGDPIAFFVCDALIAIRKEDCAQIFCLPIEEDAVYAPKSL